MKVFQSGILRFMSEIESLRDHIYRVEKKIDDATVDLKAAVNQMLTASHKSQKRDLSSLEKSIHLRMDRTEDELKTDIEASGKMLRARITKIEESFSVRLSNLEGLLEAIAEEVLEENSYKRLHLVKNPND